MKGSELLDEVTDLVWDGMQLPGQQVALAATMAAAVVCAHLRMRFIPALMVSVAAGMAAGRVAVVLDHVDQAALVAGMRELDDPGLH